MKQKIIDDKNLIYLLGGPAKLAEILGYPKAIGTQRVFNWTLRGIPAAVRLNNINLFTQRLDA